MFPRGARIECTICVIDSKAADAGRSETKFPLGEGKFRA
ncbi:hypothetical protein MPC4_30154 [Methylocella tundrae]|uniref:Uncharacterized protein n=1 Tax=Methylocella tundrae TaxID=227605 RepID=A0A8B6M7U9_METTU|nr:hypothetical protein MPC1_7890002 [Methylocella tundrae]VTZ50970.1 hypothetical protein MPC4_30154 [Methylocella tundrae]